MKTLTMVMRCGVKGTPADKMLYTLIADDYSIVTLSGAEIVKALQSKRYNVTNMGVGPKGLKATNGAIDKYTLINAMTNEVEGKASPVILNRIEAKGRLVGYTIFATDGILREINVEQALRIHASTPFSNGKLRATQDGNIVQSIEGRYPIRTVELPNKQVGKPKVNLVFIGSALAGDSEFKYMGLAINCENAADLAKIYEDVNQCNKALIRELGTRASEEKHNILNSFRIKRTGTAGIYGVLKLETALKIIKEAGWEVSNSIGNIMVSTVDYTGEEVEESRVTLSKDLKPVGKEKGTEKSNKFLKEYLEELMPRLKRLKIKN